MSKAKTIKTKSRHVRRKPLAREPSAKSLREIPEVDLSQKGRANPFAARVTRHGTRVIELPSAESLEEMPEIDFSKARGVRRNPYAAQLATAREYVVRTDRGTLRIPVGKGRRVKERETGRTSPRSVRFPEEVWQELERRAKARGMTLHAVLREAIAAWLNRAA